MSRRTCVHEEFLVFPSGQHYHAQLYAMRAPEVILGRACTKLSQVWVIGVMLLCCIEPRILGIWVSPYYIINEPVVNGKDRKTVSPLAHSYAE